MTWLEALILAVVQGLTEFLPVSSSGHLAVIGQVFQTFLGSDPDVDDLFFAVMLHVGTLLAILLFYRKEGWRAARATGSERIVAVRACGLAAVATIPAGIAALTVKSWVDQAFSSWFAPGVGFGITAALLMISSRLGSGSKSAAETSWLDALVVGVAQACALMPGISRSGSTIVAALALGFSRTWAVGFSLLMAVPAILGAAVLELKDLDPASATGDQFVMTVAAGAVATIVGYGAIAWLIRVVHRGRLWYFSVYLIVLAAVVFTVGVATGRSERTSEEPPDDAEPAATATLDRAAGRLLALRDPGEPGRPRDVDRAHNAQPRPLGVDARDTPRRSG